MPTDDSSEVEVETVATFIDLARAQSARSVLESAGIESVLRDEHTGSLHWGLMPAMGGLRLQVPADRAAEARRTLVDYAPDLADGADDPAEIAAREKARRRKRWVGIITLLIILWPCLLGLILAPWM